MATIGFLHTSPVHAPIFDALIGVASPLLRAIHVVDEPLLARARAAGPETTRSAVRARLAELVDDGADIICCTCSTLGDVAETAGADVVVFRVDRPMARRAVRSGIAGPGPRIGVVAALESTVEPTRGLLAGEAAAAGVEVAVDLVVAGEAWALFEAGDQDGYLRAIAEAARPLARRADVIVLAQASMAPAAELLAGLAVPVLSSPTLAVEHAATLLLP